MSEQILDEKLVHLKQRLEILQNVYIFFAQDKTRESFRESLLNQIEHDTKTLVTAISKLAIH